MRGACDNELNVVYHRANDTVTSSTNFLVALTSSKTANDKHNPHLVAALLYWSHAFQHSRRKQMHAYTWHLLSLLWNPSACVLHELKMDEWTNERCINESSKTQVALLNTIIFGSSADHLVIPQPKNHSNQSKWRIRIVSIHDLIECMQMYLDSLIIRARIAFGKCDFDKCV